MQLPTPSLADERRRVASVLKGSLNKYPSALHFKIGRDQLAMLAGILERVEAPTETNIQPENPVPPTTSYTTDQIITAEMTVITKQRAEIAALKAQIGSGYDAASAAAVADPDVAAALSNQSGASTASGSETSTAAAPAITLQATGSIMTDSSSRAVYTYAGTGSPDPTHWSVAGTYTTTGGSAETVYYFSGDAGGAPGTAAGVSAGTWATIPATPTA